MEIGCSNGYRPALIHRRYNAEVISSKPSKEAIEEGNIYNSLKGPVAYEGFRRLT